MKRYRSLLLDLAALLFGTALMALGISMFTVQNHIAPGGVSGLATALVEIAPFLTFGTWSRIINVPLFVIAWWKLGFRPLVKTLIGTVLLSVLIDLFALFVPTYTNNVLMAACFGGAALGVGLGILFVRGISTGGTDLVSLLVGNVLPNFSLSTILLCVDAIVVCIAVIVFRDIEVALYSFVTIFISTKAIDGVMQGFDYAKVIHLVTERGEDIQRTLADMDLGVTALPARGGYTGRDKQLLMIVTHRNTFAQTLSTIKRIDPKAFLIVTNATEVHGEGFKE